MHAFYQSTLSTCEIHSLHLSHGGGDPSVLDANYPPN